MTTITTYKKKHQSQWEKQLWDAQLDEAKRQEEMDNFKQSMRNKYKHDLNKQNINQHNSRKRAKEVAKLRDQQEERRLMDYRTKVQTMRENNRRNFYRKGMMDEKRKQNVLKTFERSHGIVCPEQQNDKNFHQIEYDPKVYNRVKLIKNPRKIEQIHKSSQILGRKTYRRKSYGLQSTIGNDIVEKQLERNFYRRALDEQIKEKSQFDSLNDKITKKYDYSFIPRQIAPSKSDRQYPPVMGRLKYFGNRVQNYRAKQNFTDVSHPLNRNNQGILGQMDTKREFNMKRRPIDNYNMAGNASMSQRMSNQKYPAQPQNTRDSRQSNLANRGNQILF